MDNRLPSSIRDPRRITARLFQNRLDLATALLLGVGILLRFVWWIHPPYNMDVYLLKAGLAGHSIAELIFDGIGHGQSAPLGFVLVGKILMCLGFDGDRQLTLPLLAVSVWTLLLWNSMLHETLAKTGGGRMGSLVGLFLFSFHPQLIPYSGFFKPYILDAFFATALLSFLVKEEANRRQQMQLSVLMALAPLFSSGSFFVIPPTLALLFLRRFSESNGLTKSSRGRSALQAILFPTCIAALSGGISFFHLTHTMPSVMMDYWAEDFAPVALTAEACSWWWLHVARLFRGPVYFTWVFYFGPSPQQVFSVLVPVAFLLIGVLKGGRKGRIVASSAILCTMMVFLASAFGRWPIRSGTPMGARLLMSLIPSITLTIVFGVAILARSFPLSFFVLFPVVFVSLAHPIGFQKELKNTWSPKEVVAFVRERCTPGTELFGTDTAHHFIEANQPEWFLDREKDWHRLSDEIAIPDLPFPSGVVPSAVILHRHSFSNGYDHYLASLRKR